MRKQFFVLLGAFALVLTMLTPTAFAQGPNSDSGKNIPFRPINPNYHAIKANIDAQSPVHPNPPGAARSRRNPSVIGGGSGMTDTSVTPPDPNGAISPTEYVEMVNEKIGVYNRSGSLLSSNTEAGFTGLSAINGDGVMLWDAGQNRFFFAALYLPSGSNELAFGFSKGPSPSAAASDWCAYHSTFGTYGADFPDYPKIGTTSDFILIGANRFNGAGTAFLGGDIVWASKPPAGTLSTCPALGSFTTGYQRSLLNANGTQASTPQPAHQADPSGTGYVLANQDPGGGVSSVLSVFQVTKDATTGRAVFGAAKTVSVAAYQYPPSAPQRGTNRTLDTLDARLMNVVSAVDPRFGGVALWTQHTVKASAGGLGSEIRWYEINPTTGGLFQNGTVSSPTLYVFTGAVSPDRLVNGATTAFGSNMVLGFNTSSSTSYSAIQMVSKLGADPQSGFVMVKQSPGKNIDFSCTPVCRWGDYSGASPDPGASPTGATGQVWLTLQWNRSSRNSMNVDWQTWNFGATP